MLQALTEYAATHPEQIAATVTGLGGALTHWKKTGKLPIGRLPYRSARQIAKDLRHRYFTKPRPQGVPALVVDCAPSTLAQTLRTQYFEYPPASYNYRSEDVNLRRPAGTAPSPTTGEPTPMEVHARGFETTDGRTLVVSHLEASRYESQGLHLDGSLTSYSNGRDRIRQVLSKAGPSQTAIESERSADIDVV
ncbi:hypothetical protein [Haloarcula sp. 1CSR25-25]|uniref:hypothetical protein n=1 Tax=Haloarcula sp. 1CSR25-25 TaxID=2862545 RepID=UPI00289461F3|nr:hypothetical protein [Haloarcula sp. 1CSR25-25]MDT3434702.1 hypothetical protein [Haloarcula sp. 1CSR25-25]